MSKFKEYIDETTNELLHKVTWPTWSELQGSAIVVMVASLIIGVLVFLMDGAFNWGLEKFYQMFN
jgi:preprotein translocase subunit SecE